MVLNVNLSLTNRYCLGLPHRSRRKLMTKFFWWDFAGIMFLGPG